MADATTTLTGPSSSAASGGRSRLLRIVGTAAGVFLGAVLLVAVWGKAITPTAFIEEIDSRGLGLLVGPAIVAYLALALEAGLGVLLLLGVRRLWVLVPAALLVAFFLSLTGQDYYRAAMGLEPAAQSCGCFGNLVVRSPAEAFWQDLFLLVPALGLAFVGRTARREERPAARIPPVRTAFAAAAAVGSTVLAAMAPDLPLDDWATRLRPGVQVTELCVGGSGEASERVCLDTVVPELEDGEHLVVLADLDEAFGERVERMNAYADRRMMSGRGPKLWVVTTAEHDERQSFFWQWAPAFEPRQAPEALLAPLYRTLPRSFTVSDGEVSETWSGLPPFERWADPTTDATRSTTP
ncbi:MAG: hypothetical protein PVG07_07515 [Acidobacteriota bacterium]|jgi:hypothetical protein